MTLRNPRRPESPVEPRGPQGHADAPGPEAAVPATEEATPRPGTAAPPSGVLVVGGGQTGRRLATRLHDETPVHHVDTDPVAVGDDRPYETTVVPDPTAAATLTAAVETPTALAVVVLENDGRNLLATQHLRAAGVGHVVVVPVDPRNADLFDLPDVSVLTPADLLADALRPVP